MAYYEDLPIWRDAMSVAVAMELAAHGFPRYHEYSLGAERRYFSYL